MTDDQTIAVYNARADDYAATFDADRPAPELTRFISALPPGASVLDLGCGTGGATAHMVDAGLMVTGMDASEKMLEHARAKSTATFRQAVFSDLDEIETYDGIWANFSLLHAARTDFPIHLSAIHAALKPNGIFHIGMKTGTGQARDKINRSYTYYAQEDLETLLKAAHMTPFHTETGAGKGLAGSVEPWVIMLSRKDR